MATTNTSIGVTLQDKASVALKSLSGNLKNVDSSVNKLKSSFGGFNAAIAPLASVASIAGLTMLGKSAIESAANIGRLSDQLGISTETLSAYKYMAEQANVPFETFSKSVGVMSKKVSEAALGTGEAVGALHELGLSAKEINKLSPDKQFLKIADAMKQIKNPSDSMRLAMKLAGEEGAKPLLTIMKDGAAGIQRYMDEAKALGVVITEEMAEKALKTQQKMFALNAEFSAIVATLAIELIPYIQKFADKIKELLDWYKNLNPDQREFYNTMVLLGIAIPIVASTLVNLVNVVKTAAIAFTAIKTFLSGGAIAGLIGAANPVVLTIGAIAFGITGLIVLIDRLNKKKIEPKLMTLADMNINGALSPEQQKVVDGLRATRGSQPKVNGSGDKNVVIDQLKQTKAELNVLLDKMVKMTGPDGTKYEFIPSQTVSDAEKAKFALIDFIRVITVFKSALDDGISISELGFDDAGNIIEKIRTYDAVSNDLLENEKKRVGEAAQIAKDRTAFMEAYALSMQQFGSVVVQQSGLGGKSPVEEYVAMGIVAVENLKSAFTDLGNGITEVMGSALTGVYEQLFGISEGAIMVGRAFGRMLSSVLGSLTAMIMKLIIAAGLTAIISSVFGGGAGATKIIGALNSWAGIGKRASGGPVGMGQPYLVGEMGPELFIPNNTGKIVPNNQLGSGRTVSVTNHITIDSKGDIFSNKLMMSRLASVINDEIENSVKKQYYATA